MLNPQTRARSKKLSTLHWEPSNLVNSMAALVVAMLAVPDVLLFHGSHEGSHSICQLFADEVCRPADCTERFDAYRQGGVTAWAGINTQSGLVLLQQVPPSGAANVSRSTSSLILVRTDLPKWTVSQYAKLMSWMAPKLQLPTSSIDPQFASPDAKLAKINMTTQYLHRAAEWCVESWRAKVNLGLALHQAGRRVFFMTYEQYLEGGDGYARSVFRDPRVRAHGSCSESRARERREGEGRQAHQAHGDYVREYASNFNDVLLHFETTPYPSWASLLSAAGLQTFAL